MPGPSDRVARFLLIAGERLGTVAVPGVVASVAFSLSLSLHARK